MTFGLDVLMLSSRKDSPHTSAVVTSLPISISIFALSHTQIPHILICCAL